eukprot:CAMPEP_0198133330 /NCGR_PEP_ID=MMETSP1442-20131203/59509_1 /TAXON_ID= /ORGANISM="Craspedostauros australis, Strain CCMP3328" /LENGTH=216 /DNA_ID=CAMNT_0043794447 /DNA_START=828 /DNA_END=1478 /DNA_ORIENTATION=+
MSKAGSRRRAQPKSPAHSTSTTASSSSPEGSRRSPRSLFTCKSKKRRSSASKTPSYTEEESFYSDTSSTAAWRVENIRPGAPTSEEWWRRPGDRSNADDQAKSASGQTNEQAKRGSFMVVGTTKNSWSDDGFIRNRADGRHFHNCGFETWEKARMEWKKQTVDTIPQKPEPPRQHELAKGLAKASNSRTFELPRRMALPDLIRTYQEIWCLPDQDK